MLHRGFRASPNPCSAGDGGSFCQLKADIHYLLHPVQPERLLVPGRGLSLIVLTPLFQHGNPPLNLYNIRMICSFVKFYSFCLCFVSTSVLFQLWLCNRLVSNYLLHMCIWGIFMLE